jgi:hypothetical protein
MTLQEIIEWLKSIKEKYIHGGDEDFDKKRKIAIDIAISALEKRIPKKITFTDDLYRMAICPCCENEFITHTGFKYCLYCGQALDWSDLD